MSQAAGSAGTHPSRPPASQPAAGAGANPPGSADPALCPNAGQMAPKRCRANQGQQRSCSRAVGGRLSRRADLPHLPPPAARAAPHTLWPRILQAGARQAGAAGREGLVIRHSATAHTSVLCRRVWQNGSQWPLRLQSAAPPHVAADCPLPSLSATCSPPTASALTACLLCGGRQTCTCRWSSESATAQCEGGLKWGAQWCFLLPLSAQRRCPAHPAHAALLSSQHCGTPCSMVTCHSSSWQVPHAAASGGRLTRRRPGPAGSTLLPRHAPPARPRD